MPIGTDDVSLVICHPHPIILGAVTRSLTSPLRSRFSAGQGARTQSIGACGVLYRREAAPRLRTPRNRGKLVVPIGPCLILQRLWNFVNFKLGHCDFWPSPLGIETGQRLTSASVTLATPPIRRLGARFVGLRPLQFPEPKESDHRKGRISTVAVANVASVHMTAPCL
jgi:hypothetical protein